jgi:hypothetical protein
MGARVEKPVEPRSQLERLLRSKAFRNSDSLRSLLAYLGEKSLADPQVELKEYTIGIEACGKPPSYDPQKDASVRVQVGRLRQRVEDYYKTEGTDDPLVLELPKGHFTIHFQPRRPKPSFWPFDWEGPALLGYVRSVDRGKAVLTGLLLAALVWGGWQYRTLQAYESTMGLSARANAIQESAPLWGPFFDRSVPTVAVFGSPAFFAGSQRRLFLRLYGLTDPDNARSSPQFSEVDRLVGPLAGPRFDYASMGDAIAIQRLSAFFASAGIALRALPAHRASWEAVKDGNVVFVGAWRMHPLLRRLPIEQEFEFLNGSQIRNRNPQPGEQEVYSTTSHRESMTYALVGSCPGLQPGREVFVVNAHSSPGAIGAVDFITTPGSIRLVQERVGLSAEGPRKHFQMLLRVYVDNDVPMKVEYVTHRVTPPGAHR